MERIIAGERNAATELAQAISAGEEASIWASAEPVGAAARGSSAPLASDLVRFEADALERTPDGIVLADDSDAALAAALVAAKLLIPLEATDAARTRSSANGRLIGQLAPAYTRSP